MSTQTTEEAIREAAYRKWQEAGSPPGTGEEFWLEAEREYRNSGQTTGTSEIDPVEEASAESFPASDPPGWIPAAATANSPGSERSFGTEPPDRPMPARPR